MCIWDGRSSPEGTNCDYQIFIYTEPEVPLYYTHIASRSHLTIGEGTNCDFALNGINLDEWHKSGQMMSSFEMRFRLGCRERETFITTNTAASLLFSTSPLERGPTATLH
jgi:hypothetical protein